MLYHSLAVLVRDVDTKSSSCHQCDKDCDVPFPCAHVHLFALLGQIRNNGIGSGFGCIIVITDDIILIAGRIVVDISHVIVIVGAIGSGERHTAQSNRGHVEITVADRAFHTDSEVFHLEGSSSSNH